MGNHVMLNNVDHQAVKIITDRSEALGDQIQAVVTFPNEYRAVQAHYPIFFQKDAQSDQFLSVALLGFEQGENLFLSDQGWTVPYIPMMHEKGPFLIGKKVDSQTGEETGVITLDMDDPRVNETQGESLFLEFGGNSPYLEKIIHILDAARQGVEVQKGFIDCLIAHDLLEPLNVDITLNDGSENRLSGYYVVHEDKLKALPAAVIKDLSDQGFLEAIYMTLASQSQLQGLVERKNAKISS